MLDARIRVDKPLRVSPRCERPPIAYFDYFYFLPAKSFSGNGDGLFASFDCNYEPFLAFSGEMILSTFYE